MSMNQTWVRCRATQAFAGFSNVGRGAAARPRGCILVHALRKNRVKLDSWQGRCPDSAQSGQSGRGGKL